MRRTATHKCRDCGLLLPPKRRQYAELSGGWAVEHAAGGAHSVHHPAWTGAVLCQLCWQRQRPRPSRGTLRPLCDDCGVEPVRYRQLAHAWTALPKANAALDARYSALALCESCYVRGLAGEQGTLFDA